MTSDFDKMIEVEKELLQLRLKKKEIEDQIEEKSKLWSKYRTNWIHGKISFIR